MAEEFTEWHKEELKEHDLKLQQTLTDIAVHKKQIDTLESGHKELEQRLIEHKVKSETTTEQLMIDVHTLKESFSGFRGEIKGSLSSLKFFIPLAITAISGIAGVIVWLLSITGKADL